MPVQSATKFDVDEFARAYAQWDVDALIGLYADDLELVQIDRDNPPSAPRVRHGKDVLRGMLEHCAAAGVKATVERTPSPTATVPLRRSPASSRAAGRSSRTGSSRSTTAASFASTTC